MRLPSPSNFRSVDAVRSSHQVDRRDRAARTGRSAVAGRSLIRSEARSPATIARCDCGMSTRSVYCNGRPMKTGCHSAAPGRNVPRGSRHRCSVPQHLPVVEIGSRADRADRATRSRRAAPRARSVPTATAGARRACGSAGRGCPSTVRRGTSNRSASAIVDDSPGGTVQTPVPVELTSLGIDPNLECRPAQVLAHARHSRPARPASRAAGRTSALAASRFFSPAGTSQ